MGDHDDAAVLRRLRTQLRSVEGLAERWTREAHRMQAPEGFRCPQDAGIAAAEIRRALAAGRERRQPEFRRGHPWS
jgi:hypothetical protein